MTRQARILATIAAAAAVAATSGACGTDARLVASPGGPAPAAAIARHDEGGGNTGTTTTTTTTPSSLSCVSEASTQNGEVAPHVWRATATLNGAAADVSLVRGRQLAASDPSTDIDAAIDAAATPSMQAAAVHMAGDRLSLSATSLGLSLRGDGSFFTGSLAMDRTSESVVCWDQNKIFGSPWGGTPGTLTAHFDWASGDCSDADGKAAMNDLPIEFIRETGFGECADLGGVRLNGDDFSGASALQFTWLAGADLSAASLFFADLKDASLQGANLDGFDFGYATVTGNVDANTQLPSFDECTTSESPWAGEQLSCER